MLPGMKTPRFSLEMQALSGRVRAAERASGGRHQTCVGVVAQQGQGETAGSIPPNRGWILALA
jgi:hypothetical protein